MSYDELGNERQKAIAELRDIQTDAGGFVKALANALGVEWQAPRVHQIIAEVRDRLIHLIGGDQPTLSDLYGIWQAGEESESRGGESAHKMTKSAEIGESGVDSTNGQSHESSPMRQENETRITDDLRNYLDTYGQEYENFSGNTIGAIRGGTTPMYEIADRIDERARLGAIKADIWQDYASQMRAERDELQEKNRHLAEKYDAMLVLLGNGAKNAKSDQERRIEKLVRQRDELREKLKEIGGIVNG